MKKRRMFVNGAGILIAFVLRNKYFPLSTGKCHWFLTGVSDSCRKTGVSNIVNQNR